MELCLGRRLGTGGGGGVRVHYKTIYELSVERPRVSVRDDTPQTVTGTTLIRAVPVEDRRLYCSYT